MKGRQYRMFGAEGQFEKKLEQAKLRPTSDHEGQDSHSTYIQKKTRPDGPQ